MRYLGSYPARAWRSLLPVLCLLVCMPPGVWAQGYLDQTGLPTFTTTEPVEMGIINVANGNLHIEIPLASASQRGELQYSAKLTYDSRFWGHGVGLPWFPGFTYGWNLIETNSAVFGRNVQSHTCTYDCGGHPCSATWYSYSHYQISDFTGTYRIFPIYFESSNECHTAATPTVSGPALDGSGYWMTGAIDSASVIAKAPDGTQVYPSLKDTNGNYIAAHK